MADIKLGLSKSAIESAKETYDGPRTPFPANTLGYTKYSAVATDIQIKQGTGASEGKAWLWVQVTNGIHQESLLINLDPSDVAPSTKPENMEKAVQRNLNTLLTAVKVLGIANNVGDGIDTTKFEAAKGTLVSFGVKRGDMQQSGYYKYYTSFYGRAESITPIDAPIGGADAPKADDDIPF